MSRTQETALPEGTHKLQKLAAKLVHLGIYASLAGIPLSGLLIGVLFWLGLRGGVLMEGAIGLHEMLISLSYWLIGLHILAALFHRLKQDGVWSAMVPLWREDTHK